MTIIESPLVNVPKDAGAVFAFLSVMKNHERIMPEQVTDFSGDKDTCTFTIKNTGTLSLRIDERNPELITLVPAGKVPFEFKMFWTIKPESASTCFVQARIEAELNFMLKMLAEKPLTNFITMQAENLAKIEV
jgi:hypothetical protein